MRKRFVVGIGFGVILVFLALSIAQFTPEEIAEWEKWEDFLKTADIVGQKQLGGLKATKAPWKISFEKDGINRDAVWKGQEGLVRGYPESWKWEIAAYRLDKYLELNMIPPTVEREFQGERGCCQLWVTTEMDLRKKEREKIETPSDKIYYWKNAVYLIRAFDNLIANEDRHQGNILITKDWRMILIDHSRSFRTSEEYTTKLIYTEKHKAGPKVMRKLPRAFVENLKTLNIKLIKDIVGEYLTDKEVEAVLKRRDLILEEIDNLIEKHGEDDVLYEF
jgi:hypothetical protein